MGHASMFFFKAIPGFVAPETNVTPESIVAKGKKFLSAYIALHYPRKFFADDTPLTRGVRMTAGIFVSVVDRAVDEATGPAGDISEGTARMLEGAANEYTLAVRQWKEPDLIRVNDLLVEGILDLLWTRSTMALDYPGFDALQQDIEQQIQLRLERIEANKAIRPAGHRALHMKITEKIIDRMFLVMSDQVARPADSTIAIASPETQLATLLGELLKLQPSFGLTLGAYHLLIARIVIGFQYLADERRNLSVDTAANRAKIVSLSAKMHSIRARLIHVLPDQNDCVTATTMLDQICME